MVYWTIMISLLAGFGGLAVFILCLRRGEFDDEESVKYQIFREDNPDN